MFEDPFSLAGAAATGAVSLYQAYKTGQKYKRAMTTWEDPASFRQLDRRTTKRGKYESESRRNRLLLASSAVSVRYRACHIYNIAVGGDPTGSTWLNQFVRGDGFVELPIHLIPLFNVNQGIPVGGGTTDLTPVAHWRLIINNNAGLSQGQMSWLPVSSVNSAGALTDRLDIEQNNMSVTEQYVAVGKKSLCDWTKAKFLFRGKLKEPSMIRVSLVRFTQDYYCPEDSWTGNNTPLLSDKAREFFTSRVRPLLSNPISNYPRLSDSGDAMVVLQQKIIMINPIDAAAETSANSDSRGHFKVFEMFNRWNRVMNYTRPNSTAQTWAQLKDTHPGTAAKQTGFAGVPRNPRDNCYIMIESLQPTATGTGFANLSVDNTVSFDWNVEMSHTMLEQTRTTVQPS